MKYIEYQTEEAIHQIKMRSLPYKYDLNIYRGCTNDCKYCYAYYSQKALRELGDPGDVIVKTNILEVLERELAAPTWERKVVNIGGVCDSYQECEANYKFMPEILRLMIKYKTPIIISTKTDLILRDLDLIDELSRITYVNIPLSITTVDPSISEKIEPGAVSPQRRFEVLKELKKTNAYTGFHVMPIIPILADDNETLETMCQWAKEADVTYMLSGILYLSGGIRKRFMNFIKEEFPQHYEEFIELYPKGAANPEYKAALHARFNALKEKYNINTSYAKFLPKNHK